MTVRDDNNEVHHMRRLDEMPFLLCNCLITKSISENLLQSVSDEKK